MFMAEILRRELLRGDFVHCGAGVGHRTHFVGIEFLPPVQRADQVYIDRYHPHELPVVGAGVAKTSHQIEVASPNTIIRETNLGHFPCRFVFFIIHRIVLITIALLPRVHRVAHPADGVLPAQNLGVFDFKHQIFLLSNKRI